MHVRNIFPRVSTQRLGWSLLGLGTLLLASPAAANAATDARVATEIGANTRAGNRTVDIAQVNNANLGCYLYDFGGTEYDLSVLCANEPEPEPTEEVVLQTGDVQVTLRWDTADDLDLYVTDPAGDSVFYGNSSVPSGGQLDVDANLGCSERMANPVENIFWPTDGGVPGNYVAAVRLFSFCETTQAPIDFTLTTLVRGETQTYTGTLSSDQGEMTFPFSFSETGAVSAPAANAEAGELPVPPALPAIPTPSR